MATGLPFSPATGATAGKTVKVTANNTPTSVAGTLNCAASPSNNVLVTNNGTIVVFVRLSAEAAPTATAADVPIPAGQSRMLQNPVPNGVTGLAALSSTTTSADVYFTPGWEGA